MTVYVVGNCQAHPLALCLAAMNPGLAVLRRPITTDVASFAEPDDLIFRQRNPRVPWTLREPRRNEILYPRVWFNAFHPDLVLLQGPFGSLQPPLGRLHSSLVLYGWHRGLSPARTVTLFCEPVFERLGFFRYWRAAQRTMLEEGTISGCPLDGMFERWQRLGAFMHTPDHPALGVTADIARLLVRRSGLPAALDTPEYYLNDPLLYLTVWPVYPEIAARLGVSGSYGFKPAQQPEWEKPVQIFGLEEFVERSFTAYAQAPPSALGCARLENPAYRDLERLAAHPARTSLAQQPGEEDAGDEPALRRLLEAEANRPNDAESDVGTSAASMDALARSSMRAPIDVSLPSAMVAGSVITVPCTVKNDGDVALITAGKHPVYLCYRWYDEAGKATEVGRAFHTPLPAPLAPAGTARLSMRIAAPRREGSHRLHVTLLQSEVAWFDDVDPNNGVAGDVEIKPSRPTTPD